MKTTCQRCFGGPAKYRAKSEVMDVLICEKCAIAALELKNEIAHSGINLYSLCDPGDKQKGDRKDGGN